ncbi:uncharacterized protein [Procambarus clarkii]|uniref:uncharacterized protein n=1 Tax=Procambarus clarkii TaxID=6728 RepID=UPI003743B514
MKLKIELASLERERQKEALQMQKEQLELQKQQVELQREREREQAALKQEALQMKEREAALQREGEHEVLLMKEREATLQREALQLHKNNSSSNLNTRRNKPNFNTKPLKNKPPLLKSNDFVIEEVQATDDSHDVSHPVLMTRAQATLPQPAVLQDSQSLPPNLTMLEFCKPNAPLFKAPLMQVPVSSEPFSPSINNHDEPLSKTSSGNVHISNIPYSTNRFSTAVSVQNSTAANVMKHLRNQCPQCGHTQESQSKCDIFSNNLFTIIKFYKVFQEQPVGSVTHCPSNKAPKCVTHGNGSDSTNLLLEGTNGCSKEERFNCIWDQPREAVVDKLRDL